VSYLSTIRSGGKNQKLSPEKAGAKKPCAREMGGRTGKQVGGLGKRNEEWEEL